LDITTKELEFLNKHLTPDWEEMAVPNFRILIKTHKKVLAGRPIAGAWNWISTPFSKYLSKKLRPLIEKTFPFFLRDTKAFVQRIDMLRQQGVKKGSHRLCIADVKAMYPSIDIKFGLKALQSYLLETQKMSRKMVGFICDMAEMVLTSNVVQFGGEFFLQKKGTAMGTNFAPEYAYTVYWAIEKLIFNEIQLNSRPRKMSTSFGIVKYYGRYIDDLFLVLEI
jgi:hypothetical protein